MKFDQASTVHDVLAGIDLTGKTAVVTGTSAGLGAETARGLAKAGAFVVMAARNGAKNEAVAGSIRSDIEGAKLRTITIDLADFGSVRRAAAEIMSLCPVVDILINNAGFVGGPRVLTPQGAELHFAANHLGPFLLTNLLMPALKAAASSRIIVVSSNGHRMGGFDIDDLNFGRRDYNHWTAYSQSKMANVLHAVGLAERLNGTNVTAYSLHPGVIRTEVFRSVTTQEEEQITSWTGDNGSPLKSLAQGAATQVWGATSTELNGITGVYLEDCQIAKVVPSSTMSAFGVIEEALDLAIADRLWSISEGFVGQRFDIA
jgi:NAD(P)-dependent dehydrogenase (short-subunit alcohol dehydrogenase family)